MKDYSDFVKKMTFINDSTGEKKTWQALAAHGRELEAQKQAPEPEAEQQRFGAHEHETIGDQALAQFLKDKKKRKRKKAFLKDLGKQYFDVEKDGVLHKTLRLSDTIALTPGQIVALGGDFYGIPNRPICEGTTDNHSDSAQARFLAAYESLASLENKEEVDNLLKLIEEEAYVIKAAKALGMRPDLALAIGAHERDHRFAQITRYFPLVPSLLYSRYADLALTNFDHFGPDAKTAFEAGYEVAIQTAKEGDLAKALSQAFFACHYLTDMFAAGHMRTPRRELSKILPPVLSGLLAKAMHDEDNQAGLKVSSETVTDGWLAKGDSCLFNPECEEHFEQSVNAVKAVIEDIYKASRNPKQKASQSYQAHLPSVLEDNHPALFKVDASNGKVLCREPLSYQPGEQRGEVSYEELHGLRTPWGITQATVITTTLLKQQWSETPLSSQDQEKLEEEIKLLTETQPSVARVPRAKNYSPTVLGSSTATGAAAAAAPAPTGAAAAADSEASASEHRCRVM